MVGCVKGFQASEATPATSVYVCGNTGGFAPEVGQPALSCIPSPIQAASTTSTTDVQEPLAPAPPASTAPPITTTTTTTPTTTPEETVLDKFQDMAEKGNFGFADGGRSPTLDAVLAAIADTNIVPRVYANSFALGDIVEDCLDQCQNSKSCGAAVLSVPKAFADEHVYGDAEVSMGRSDYECTGIPLGYENGGGRTNDMTYEGDRLVYWAFSKQ